MNPRQIAAQKARKYGVPTSMFLRQMGLESGFKGGQTSPKGAQGYAQIMPGTAKAWGVRNPNDPNEAYDAAAKHMRIYYDKHGSWEAALRAYNAGEGAIKRSYGFAETNNYVRSILKGGSTKGGTPPQSGTDRSILVPRGPIKTKLVDTGTKTDTNAALMAALERHAAHPGSSLAKLALDRIGSGQYDVQTHQRVRVPGVQAGATRVRLGSGATVTTSRGAYSVDPNANRPGTKLAGTLTHFLSLVSGHYGSTVEVGTGTNHNRMTVNGRVSDHFDGHAADIPANANTTAGRRKGDAIAYAAFRAAGVPEAKARLWSRNGGLYNVTYNGHRVQIIWKTNEGGNHFTHVHIGIR